MPKGGPGIKRGPRPGSRPWTLVNMKVGDRLFFEAHNSTVRLMQQIGADMHRNGLTGKIRQTHVLGIDIAEREVLDLVLVERIEE
jgi:hypothetical protein